MSTTQSAATTYYLKLPYRLLALAIMVVGLIPGLLILPSFSSHDFSADRLGTYVFALIMFVALFDLVLWIGYLLLRIRLVISAQGVVFKAAGYTIRSSWANVASLETISTSRGPQRGLILNQPGLEMGGCLSSLLTLLPGLLLMNLLRGRPTPNTSIDNSFIPIEPFESDRLLAEIQRYAPQLTNAPDNRSDMSPNEPAPDAAPTDRVNWLPRLILLIGIVAIEIAFIGLSVQAWQGDVSPLQTIQVHLWPDGLTFSRDSQTVLVLEARQLQWWRVADGTLQQTRDLTKTYSLATFAVSHDEQTFAAGMNDGTVQAWHSDGSLRYTLGHVEKVACPPCGSNPPVAFSPDDQLLASGSADGTVHVWQIKDGQEVLTLKATPDAKNETITDVAFSPDGQWLAAGAHSLDKAVQIWQITTGKLSRAYPGSNSEAHTFANSVSFTRDGQWLAASTLNQGVWLLRPAEQGLKATLDVPKTTEKFDQTLVAFSPDGQYLASVTSGGALLIWRLSDNTLLRTLRAHTQGITHLAFSPDGRYLATAAQDDTVRLWSVVDVTK